ncbi:MAG: beta-lactamase family protein [Clostridiales Family XIII bacterium]|nr:beta-lactamase family protein [Clostridiales Family XIII bacterium]
MREQIGDYVEQAAFNFDLAGLLCGVRVREDSPLECAGFDAEFACGYADFEHKIPFGTGDATHFASVSKLFVTAAVLRLAAGRRMDVNDRLTAYLPDFRMADERYRDITLRHILSHTSGIPDIEDYHWRDPETDGGALYRYAHSDEVRSLRLLWEPGTGRFKYSNIAFDVLGAALETVTGRSFERIMADFFFRPLGMANSTFLTPLRARGGPRLAKPHYKDAGNHLRVQDYFPYNRAHAPSSTLSSTLSDIKKWGDAWIDAAQSALPAQREHSAALPPQDALSRFDAESAALLHRELVAEALTPCADIPNSGEKIGLGWFIRKQNGRTLYGHEGADDGFRSSFWICPELGMQITVLANLDRAPVKKIGKRIFEILAGN